MDTYSILKVIWMTDPYYEMAESHIFIRFFFISGILLPSEILDQQTSIYKPYQFHWLKQI